MVTILRRIAYSQKEMNIIPLTKGKEATVDNIDYSWASQFRWQALESKRKGSQSVWYATRKESHSGPTLYMHREIAMRMGLNGRFVVDHVDRNGLNNARNNIRKCLQRQNLTNRCKSLGKSSRFKGVYFYKRLQLWCARIKLPSKFIHLGYFDRESDAAKKYNEQAIIHFGEFALLNEI